MDYTTCLEECADNLDNDGNCAYDTDDIDCDGDVEICNDGVDNDGDLLVDCSDPDCLGVIPEACADGIDNDCDGYADSEDSDCGSPCPAGAQASTFRTSPVYGTPDLFKRMAPVLFLAGALVLWSSLRKKK